MFRYLQTEWSYVCFIRMDSSILTFIYKLYILYAYMHVLYFQMPYVHIYIDMYILICTCIHLGIHILVYTSILMYSYSNIFI